MVVQICSAMPPYFPPSGVALDGLAIDSFEAIDIKFYWRLGSRCQFMSNRRTRWMIRRRLDNPDPLPCVIIDFPVALKLLPKIVNFRHLPPLVVEIFAFVASFRVERKRSYGRRFDSRGYLS